MELLSTAAIQRAEEKLAAMVGPVLLRVPAGDSTMRTLAVALSQVADGELLNVGEWEGESLALLDGWGRETGIHFRDPPVGQEFGALLDAILAVSRGGSVLTPLGRAQAGALPEGSAIRVLVTPT